MVEIGDDYELVYVSIVVEDTKTGVFRTHPLTHFILENYTKYEDNYNTQKAAASYICRFCNWVFIENQNTYKLISLEELSVDHSLEYLNYLKTNKYYKGKKDSVGRYRDTETLEKYDLYITAFYSFLNKQKILKGFTANLVDEHTYTNHKGNEVTSSIHIGNGFSLPRRSSVGNEFKLETFPDNKLIVMFLESADAVAEDIAFGIYLQIFGGLRRGEVINASISDLKEIGPNGRDGLRLRIKYRPEYWTRLKDISKCKVKRDTNVFPVQPIQIIPSIAVPLLKSHKKYLDKHQKVNKQDALFIDCYGNPMSGSAYEDRFTKVKEHFLERVKDQLPGYYHTLTFSPWNTHIGRRIYTNLMAAIVKSPSELAILRGDKTLETALIYMSKQAVGKEIQDGLQDMYERKIQENKSFSEGEVDKINDSYQIQI